MKTLAEATEIAKKVYPEIDTYEEDTLTFTFYNSKDDDSFGGTDPVVVYKEDGKVISLSAYLCEDVKHGERVTDILPIPN